MKCHCEQCSKDPLPTYTQKFKHESFVREIASREGGSIRAYYNESDPKAAAWLRQLIKNGNITPGEVDERSITEVRPDDLIGFDRVHFFSGIGTWDYCLNQSGWGDRPIWTASLPCQPFSAAGKGLGKADERHLLPHFLELVRECRPATILGEQVAAAIGHGWLDDLYAEMEACEYAIGSAVIGAHSIGSPHIRQRLYWVANSNYERSQRRTRAERTDQQLVGKNGVVDGMVYSNESGSQQRIETAEAARHRDTAESTGSINGFGDPEHEQHQWRLSGSGKEFSQNRKRSAGEFAGSSEIIGLGNSGIATGERDTGELCNEENSISGERLIDGTVSLRFADASEIDWIYCRDNKYRPVKPGILPLVDGVARGMVHSSDPSEPINANGTQEARAIRLKGYGNAIQAQTAIAFITAFMSV